MICNQLTALSQQKPKITRITAAPLADDQGLESDSDDGGPRLIETSVAAEEERLVSVQSRYWQSKHGGVDCFLKLPNDVLTEVAQATGAQLAIETESKRVRVSSLNPAQVDDALERLDNLEQSSVSFEIPWTFWPLNYLTKLIITVNFRLL